MPRKNANPAAGDGRARQEFSFELNAPAHTEIAATTQAHAEFSKSRLGEGAAESRSRGDENPPTLKMFEREDWTLFRTIEGLAQKAGVALRLLRRLVLKELGDNAADTGAKISFGRIDASDKFYVEDDGPGLEGTPEEIAALFSIRRPMRSSKLLRLPQRGALGDGLRVVAGAVLASEGSLAVITRNRRIILRPRADGHTEVVKVTAANRPRGTRIEIGFGPALPPDPDALAWVQGAASAGVGKSYEGRSSPFWYNGAHFHELLLACGAQPVRALIAELDGCTGGKAGEIVAAAGLDRMTCGQIERPQAVRLLKAARREARPVSPERLGGIGRDGFGADLFYAVERGTAELGRIEPRAEIPFVVEAWARKTTTKKGDFDATLMINRTPAVDELIVWRDAEKDLWLDGNGLDHYGSDAPKNGSYVIVVNVTTPYCPITSDGKAPDLFVFADCVMAAIEAAMRKAQRAAPKDKKISQKDIVLDNLDDAVASASGDGQFRFNERQVFYQLRQIVLEKTDSELRIGNFKAIITDYENENGEIPGMYREPRGSIYHPHCGDDIPLGTLTVENYERPPWTFNSLLYIEKEGFKEALKDDGWPERHDCALISSKGFTTRAAKDLVDKLAEHDEPVTIFCVHDADAFGTMIYETFQEATKARGARKINIVNLGLEPWEAIEAGLDVEDVERGDQRKAVASYVHERGAYWSDWLQIHRAELNSMTTPQFIEWLDNKMAEHGDGKLIPPDKVIVAELDDRLEENVRAAVRDRILLEANYEKQVAETLAAIKRPNAARLIAGIKKLFAHNQEHEWRVHIIAAAKVEGGRS